MAFPRRARAALAALCLLAAAACGQVGDDERARAPDADEQLSPRPRGEATGPSTTELPPAPTPATPPSNAPRADVDLGGASRYVALGDSFSAGGGLGPYDEPTCGRSGRAYPHLVRFVGPVEVEVQACEAARVADVATQAGAVAWGEDVGLVTVTVGGNDVGFVDFFGACALRPNCFEAPYAGQPMLWAWSEARLAALGPELEAVLVDVRARAPRGRVVLLGYPQLLPAALEEGPGCQLLGVAFDPSELRGLRSSTTALNAVLAAAADAAGVAFVPVADRFAGHEACGGGESWLLFGGAGDLLNAPEGLLHPSEAGQAAYADALADALRG